MSGAPETCALCPRLCRPSCPVAVGSAREAAVPAVIAEVLLSWKRGDVDDELARASSTLCTGCGACQRHCHLDVDLPRAIGEAWSALVAAPEIESLQAIEGEGDLLALETDDREWGAALQARLGQPVAVLRTTDALGAYALELGERGHLSAVRTHLRGQRVVVAHGGAARVLQAAGVSAVWLHELIPELGETLHRSCVSGGAGCCGAAGPLSAHHPATARRMAQRWAGGASCDARCRSFLARHGVHIDDSVTRLMECP